jgi:hypothetical protein
MELPQHKFKGKLQNRIKHLNEEINNLKDGLATARNNEERLYFLDGITERKAAMDTIQKEKANQPKDTI